MSIFARLSNNENFEANCEFEIEETPVGYLVPFTVIIVVAVVVKTEFSTSLLELRGRSPEKGV